MRLLCFPDTFAKLPKENSGMFQPGIFPINVATLWAMLTNLGYFVEIWGNKDLHKTMYIRASCTSLLQLSKINKTFTWIVNAWVLVSESDQHKAAPRSGQYCRGIYIQLNLLAFSLLFWVTHIAAHHIKIIFTCCNYFFFKSLLVDFREVKQNLQDGNINQGCKLICPN